MLHVQLHRFPHSARAFNLSEDEVRATIVEPWEAGRLVEFGERFWTPGECKLTILEGPRLDAGQLGLGRGWAAARSSGRDVTSELIGSPSAADPARVAPGRPFEDFKDEVLALSLRAPAPLPELWRLACHRYPERTLGEQLGLAERAVRELVRDDLAAVSAFAPVGDAEVEALLRALETWAVGSAEVVTLRGTARGERAHRRG